MSNATKMTMLIGGALMALGTGAPALADHVRGHTVRAHPVHANATAHRSVPRLARISRRPARVAITADGSRYPYVDDGSRYDTEFDGSSIGREGDLIPRDGSGPRYVRQGGSFELSGPPISPSLPVVPELVDPSLY